MMDKAPDPFPDTVSAKNRSAGCSHGAASLGGCVLTKPGTAGSARPYDVSRMPSFDRPADADIAPSAWVMRFAHLIAPGGRVLDLACGHGRHARSLAAHGFRVIAADIDTAALAASAGPNLEVVQRDLEDGSWPWAAQSLDAVVVTNYLHRPHFPRINASLREGGVLLFETFGAGNEQLGRPRNPDFLLQPGELLQAFAGLQVIAYEHGIEREPRPAVRQRLCAIRGALPVELGELREGR